MADFALSTTSTAVLLGFAPTVFWLFFWLRTDRDHPEPFGLLVLCFILGGASVFFASTIQHASVAFFPNETTQVAVWATIEEVVKFAAFYIIAFNNPNNDEAIDPAIYMIAVALGFAAVENVFYVIQPSVIVGGVTASLLTGSMRFFGATLLHTISSAFIGITIGITARKYRLGAVLIGILGASTLHATFNFFILKNDTASALQIYGYLWVAAIISHVTLEKLRRIPNSGTLTI
jgi:RsiW-degrading membrane proteinase PrsW (M82 family)